MNKLHTEISRLYPLIGGTKTAKKLNMDYQALYKIARKLGVCPTRKESCVIRDRDKRKLQYSKYKELLNTKNDFSVYLLGFIWADGHVSVKSRIVITKISAKDAEIGNTFKAIGPWKIETVTRMLNGKPFQGVVISANSVLLAEELAKLGFVKKSEEDIDKVLEVIPEDKHYLFFRGYFDGDGYIGFNKIGQYKIVIAMNQRAEHKTIVKYFLRMGLNPVVSLNTTKKGHKSKTISLFRKNEVKNLLDWMYGGAPKPCLTRKYNKYQELAAHIKQINYTKTNPKSIPIYYKNIKYNSIREASRITGIDRAFFKKPEYVI